MATTRTALFIATFADGYRRSICAPSLDRAIAFAQDLDSWFASGRYPGRILTDVIPAKR
jgi:hypothetical protein